MLSIFLIRRGQIGCHYANGEYGLGLHPEIEGISYDDDGML